MWNMLLGAVTRLPARVTATVVIVFLLVAGLWAGARWIDHQKIALAHAEQQAEAATEQVERQRLIARAWQTHARRLAELGAERQAHLEKSRRELALKRQQIEELLDRDETSKKWADSVLPDGVPDWLRQLTAAPRHRGDGKTAAAEPPDSAAASAERGAERRAQPGSDHAGGGL